MTDHADTIRRTPELIKLAGWAMQNDPESPSGELVREWKRLLAERQQAIDALREAANADAGFRFREHAIAALAKIGEQP